ncbi:MAG: hypothetical protein ACK2UT_00190 [Candidatus Promineifilaceae bacterium]
MKRLYLITFIVLLASLLAACGGSDAAQAPAQPEGETAVSEAAPESTVEEPAEEAVAPTEAPEPTDEPTAEPEPTEAPEPTPEPTAEPAEEAASSGEGWGESGSTAQSACDHPYFPLRTGTTWTMVGEEGDPITWEVANVEGDMQSATADMVLQSGDLELHYTWECSADGGLVSFDFGTRGLGALGTELTIESSEGTGMFLPPLEELEPGFSWDSSFHSTYSIVQPEGDAELELSGEMDTAQTSTVINNDPVTFNEQTVPGLLVQQDSEITMVMSMMGSDITNVMDMGSEMQLGWGLGMLSQTSSTDLGDVSMEATEIYVP